MSGVQFVELAVGGLAIGCIYSLIALGMTMIIRATGIVHFAQGEIVMVGAVLGLSALLALHLPFLAVLIVGMVIAGLAAVAIELGIYRTLRARYAALEHHHRDSGRLDPAPERSSAGLGLRAEIVSETFRGRSIYIRGGTPVAPS